VGAHTTQFEIRQKGIDLLEPVLRAAADALDEIQRHGGKRLVRIAGICGQTVQACGEAALAASLGYHAGLLSLAALAKADDDELVSHCQKVAAQIPLVGFYLQPAVGGRPLGVEFWRRFAQIPSVVAIKIAPFNRYQTLDVVRGVALSGRAGQVALYTGNDDNIVSDLLTEFAFRVNGQEVRQRIVGGLLGHWAVWTSKAVELLGRCHEAADVRAEPQARRLCYQELLTLAGQVTDCNAALFDVAHNFAGCIAGIQHVLAGQGLLGSTRCLNPRETLSPGQAQEIDRVRREYPHLIDDDFVAAHLKEWLE
jgi:hypothetical protein